MREAEEVVAALLDEAGHEAPAVTRALRRAGAGLTQADPAIWVVIATRNRRDRLERLIAAVDRQELGEPFEAVVVDDASTDETQALLSAAAESARGCERSARVPGRARR